MIELIRHSFSAHQVEAAGLAPQRLNFFARLAQKVPMRRLIYPADFEHLRWFPLPGEVLAELRAGG